MQDILTIAEVANQLRCSVSTVRQHIACGRLAAIDLGTGSHKHYRITESAFAEFLQAAPELATALPPAPKLSINTSRFMKRLG